MLKKLSIFLINFIILMFVGCNIFAYNLEFDGEPDENGDIVFYNIVKSSSRSRSEYNSNSFTKMNTTPVGSSYVITGIVFQDAPTTNYTSSGGVTPMDANGYYITNSNYNVAYYDTSSIVLKEDNVGQYFGSGSGTITKVASENTSVMKKEINGNAIKIECKLYGSSNEYVITKYSIPKNIFEDSDVKKIIESYKQKNNGKEGVYVSFITNVSGYGDMATAYDFYSSIFQKSSTASNLSRWATEIDNLEAERKKLSERLSQLEEAARNGAPSSEIEPLKREIEEKRSQIAKSKLELKEQYDKLKAEDTGSVWAPYVKGVDTSGNYARGYSAINDYDNILNLKDLGGEKIIYVNYAEDDGSGKLKEIKGVVPKYRVTLSDNLDLQFIHAYSDDNKVSWMDLVKPTPEGIKSEIEKEHEKYTFSKLNVKNFARFIRMSEDELLEKKEIKYKYKKLIVYEGDSKDTFDDLWKKVQENEGESSDKSTTTISVDKSKPCIVTFVYTPGKQRTVYVNYVKEKADKSLVELAAPKYEKTNELDQGIHEYSLTGSWLDLLSKYNNISPVYEKYEEYSFTNLEDPKNSKLQAKFIHMSVDELNARLGLFLTEDDDVENEDELAFKYLGLKYCYGKKGANYEALLEKNKNSTLHKSPALQVKIPEKQDTTLVSFLYKAPKKEYLNVEVVHENLASENLIPIAEDGHSFSPYAEKEVSNDREHAYYKVNSGTATASVITTTWAWDNVEYKFLDKIRVEYFISGGVLASYTTLKTGVSSVNLLVKEILENAYDKVKISFLYGVEGEPADAEIIYCAFLSFKSTRDFNKMTDCDQGMKGQILLDCLYCYGGGGEPPKPNTSLLTLPTDNQIQGSLYAHGYSLSDLEQIVSLETHDARVEIERDEYEHVDTIPNADIIQVCDGEEEYHPEGTPEGTIAKRPICHDEPADHWVIKGPKHKFNPAAAAEIAENQKYTGNVPMLNVPAIIDLGEFTECFEVKCPNCGQGGWTKIKYHGFVETKANYTPIKFNSYFLNDATLNNFDGDETKLIGTGRENVMKNDGEIEFGVEAQLPMLRAYINMFEGETSLRGKQFRVVDTDYYQELALQGKFPKQLGAPYLEKMAGNMADVKGNRNSSAKQYFYTSNYLVEPETFNGERLSIAKLHYNNWTREIDYTYNKEPLKGFTNLAQIYGLTTYVNSGQLEIIKTLADKFNEQVTEKREADAKWAEETGGENLGCDNPSIPMTNAVTVPYKDEIATKIIEKLSDTNGVNVVNPATLKSVRVESPNNLVNHTVGSNTTFNLQVGAETIATPELSETDAAYGSTLSIKERKSYIKYYIYKFNFPVIVNGNTYGPNTPITIEVNGEGNSDLYDDRGSLRFIPTGSNSLRGNYTTSDVDIRHDEIYVAAVTKNVPSLSDAISLFEEALSIRTYFGIGDQSTICSGDNINTTRNTASSVLVGLGTLIRDDARYLSNMVYIQSTNISRVFDFRVTDCTDVNFKNVFRKDSTTSAGVSEHTGKIYFSGIRKLDVFTNTYSSNDEEMILPLGPYKQPGGYVDAPKIGYRISYDLKTSGFYDFNSTTQTRTVVILPEFYYVGKDGTGFTKNVDAYYKNSNNKYVKIVQAPKKYDKDAYYNAINNRFGGYQITYIPNDGYRNVLNLGITSVTDMFKAENKTLDMASIILNKEMMCTNNDGFIQSWYGEYKLPNSTILVNKGETDLNKQLKDGYLGVIFHIGVVEQVLGGGESIVVISYETTDKNKSSQHNTSEWDYEGYIKFKNPGSAASSLKLQLAKGTWNIDDATYQEMKGTVVLYDLDNRAASDFE